MKLLTTIKPRRSGEVAVVGEDGQKYVFEADAELGGALTCDVTDEVTVARLLVLGEFEPANPDDADAAVAIYNQARQSGVPDDADDSDEDEDFSEMPAGGLPLEANTPPVPKKPRKRADA